MNGVSSDPRYTLFCDEPLIAWQDHEQAGQRLAILRHGWAATAVFGDDIGESFAYTVGLTGFDHPELLLTGMPPEVAGRLLNGAGERVRSGDPLAWSALNRPGGQAPG